MSNTPSSTLSDLRVLDLTDIKGALCAKLFGDMGAAVIKIELPSGDAMRTIGPFLDGKPHRDRSLLYWFYNTSKRGVTLNLEHHEGRQLLKQLVTKADVMVESFTPGTLEGWDLGYEQLKRLNPQLVLTSITPFGQTGPYRDYASFLAAGRSGRSTGSGRRPARRS